MDENNLKEKDFQRYVGWKTPVFIKIAWSCLLMWILFYFSNYLYPSLKVWLNK